MNNRDFKKIFNMNTIMTTVLNYAAYIVLIASVGVLIYLSFIKTLKVSIDVLTFSVFTTVVVILSFVIWNMFYKRRYEKTLADDIAQHEKQKYSIHVRYYNAIKDWNNVELQTMIDEYNKKYIADWLYSVEVETGIPIETKYVQEIDEKTGEVKLDENGKIKYKKILGIKDRPYKGFSHKILMWRIKHHRYPKSGYKSAISLMSLFSYREGQLNKRNLSADKRYFVISATLRFLLTIFIVTIGISLTPDILEGNFLAMLMKLSVGLWMLISSTISGSITGLKSARIKLSTVEDVCVDLEQWAHKKPIIEKYEITKNEISIKQNSENDSLVDTYENIFTIADEK